MTGKAYANRKPESDFYPTPKSLTWALSDLGVFNKNEHVLDPACGDFAIVEALEDRGFKRVGGTDLKYGDDFLKCSRKYPQGVMNPPFSLFDPFILKAQDTFEVFASIIKMNFFGAYQRNEAGIWRHLKHVYIFNRQVDYRTPQRNDGRFHVGNLVTAWGIWDMQWDLDFWRTTVLDVNRYATLGQFKEVCNGDMGE